VFYCPVDIYKKVVWWVMKGDGVPKSPRSYSPCKKDKDCDHIACVLNWYNKHIIDARHVRKCCYISIYITKFSSFSQLSAAYISSQLMAPKAVAFDIIFCWVNNNGNRGHHPALLRLCSLVITTLKNCSSACKLLS
jgi:hypothetical protein